MHTIFSIFSLQNLITELRRVISRFPLSALCILIVTGILSYENAMSNSDISSELRDTLGYITIASGIAFFLATALDLFLEQVHRKWVYRVIGYIGTIAYAFYLYTSLESRMSSTESTTLILLSLFGFLITLFFAPYIRDLVQKKYSQEAYIHYFYSIAIAFLTAMIMSGILMILGSIALWSIDTLFTVDWIGDKAYGYMAIFSFAFVAPLFGLSRIPGSGDTHAREGKVNVFFAFLVTYVGTPFICIYFLILYAYSAYVLMHFNDWPQGQVSWMVIGFSTFSYVLYIFSEPIALEGRIVNLVRNILPAVVLPQVAMLFYAIYLRIAQYDFTINRYFVVVFGLWLVGISLYFLISREKRLIMITVSLAVITLLISVGPWSVYHLPLARQYSRLVANLETAGILSNGQIKPLATYESIDVTLSDDIYTGIEYVCGFDHCRLVRALFEPSLPTLVQAEKDREKNWEKDALEYQKCQTLGQFDCYRKVMEKEMSSWEIREHIASIIKVRVKPYQGDNEYNAFLNFSLDESSGALFPIDIAGYERIFSVAQNTEWSVQQKNILLLDTTGSTASLIMSGQLVDTFSIKDFESSLLETFRTENKLNLPKDQMTVTLDGKAYSVKLYLRSISILNPTYITPKKPSNIYLSADGYALIRKK